MFAKEHPITASLLIDSPLINPPSEFDNRIFLNKEDFTCTEKCDVSMETSVVEEHLNMLRIW